MSKNKSHDLHDFMQQLSDEMAAEYDRIQKRVGEDPGTAGGQGEENWAELLRGWLPRTYTVVTKGRIISHEGVTSPEIDVLVLRGTYPQKLLNKKLYLAAGVAAAFECKITLRASHIEKAVKTCAKVKSLYPVRVGTPYKELHSPIIYGLLAHSHSWKEENSTPEGNVERRLREADRLRVSHPRLQLDLLCVADLATWAIAKHAAVPQQQIPGTEVMYPESEPDGYPISAYVECTKPADSGSGPFTPIGALISRLSVKLAWEEPALRDLADYYRSTELIGFGKGEVRMWPSRLLKNPGTDRTDLMGRR